MRRANDAGLRPNKYARSERLKSRCVKSSFCASFASSISRSKRGHGFPGSADRGATGNEDVFRSRFTAAGMSKTWSCWALERSRLSKPKIAMPSQAMNLLSAWSLNETLTKVEWISILCSNVLSAADSCRTERLSSLTPADAPDFASSSASMPKVLTFASKDRSSRRSPRDALMIR